MEKSASNEIKKRFCDLSRRSYQNGQYTFTDFLSMADLSDFYEITKLPKDHEFYLSPAGYSVWGGYSDSERCMIRFGNEEELGYEVPFPICCISIKPLQKKFADNLSHRDFLGALINLGIERTELGDILVKDKECFLFAKESMAPLICNELTRVRHTTVQAVVCEFDDNAYAPDIVEGSIQASGFRIDSFLAKVLKLSRNASSELFLSSKVFVNGRLMSNESYQLKESDVISVRGFGKFVFNGSSGSTRKGNHIISYSRYV